jgi:hypothetical protein
MERKSERVVMRGRPVNGMTLAAPLRNKKL